MTEDWPQLHFSMGSSAERKPELKFTNTHICFPQAQLNTTHSMMHQLELSPLEGTPLPTIAPSVSHPVSPRFFIPFLNLVPSLQSHTGASRLEDTTSAKKKKINFLFIDGKVFLHLLNGIKSTTDHHATKATYPPTTSGHQSLWNQLGLSNDTEETF